MTVERLDTWWSFASGALEWPSRTADMVGVVRQPVRWWLLRFETEAETVNAR